MKSPIVEFAKLLAFGLMAALLWPVSSRAQVPGETNAYRAATNLFNDAHYPQAELSLSNFVAVYTNSPLRPGAALFMARARIAESNYTGALELLIKDLPEAGLLGNEYVYRIAEARFSSGDYTNSAEGCSNLLSHVADPALRLNVSFLEALSWSRLQQWPTVIALLSNPSGAFQTAARRDPDNLETVNGFLLLGEAALEQSDYAQGENALRQITAQNLPPVLKWRRDYLLCRILLAGGKTDEAWANITNMAQPADKSQRAAGVSLQGEILERLNRPSDALQVYTNNLAEDLPPDVNRQALDKTIVLTLQTQGSQGTIQWLRNFIRGRPNDTNLDLASFYLGDLYLKEYFAPDATGTNTPPAATNFLEAAITNLDRVIVNYSDSPLSGKAHLDRGWCDWAQEKMPEAEADFLRSMARLPHSEEQAVAIFKLADAQFRQGNYAGAETHYKLLIQDYANMAGVTNNLFDVALYQIVQAGVQLGDEAAAMDAVEKIQKWYPSGSFGERSLLLMGEDWNRQQSYANALKTFSDLLAKYPNTALLPEIRLDMARAYEQSGDLTNALAAYDDWIANTNFATNTVLLADAEFSRALAYQRAGIESNALIQMTNFVAQFPSNSLAPWAQNWVADYYMNQGHYADADFEYQKVYKNYPGAGELAYQARLMAGRAASKHQDLPQATNDFSILINDTNTPAAVLAQAYFQMGYTAYQQFQADNTNAALLNNAIVALSWLTNGNPTNALVAQALGQLGNCNLALADSVRTNRADFTVAMQNASNLYQTVLNLPKSQTDVTARSQAEYGLGLVAERLNDTNSALAHYFKLLPVYDGTRDQSDPFWVQQAGVKAATLYERQGKWAEAITVYERVEGAVPSLTAEMERNIADAKSKIKTTGN